MVKNEYPVERMVYPVALFLSNSDQVLLVERLLAYPNGSLSCSIGAGETCQPHLSAYHWLKIGVTLLILNTKSWIVLWLHKR